MGPVMKALATAALVLTAWSAYSAPLTYRADYVVEEIQSGCDGRLPCGHVPGPTFSLTFSFDSSLLELAPREYLIPLLSPLDFIGDAFFKELFKIEELFVVIGSGTVRLSGDAAQPLIPDSCHLTICPHPLVCSCGASGGMSFGQTVDGRWFDAWTLRVADVAQSGRVVGTYSVHEVTAVPEAGTLGLIGIGIATFTIRGLRGRRPLQKASQAARSHTETSS